LQSRGLGDVYKRQVRDFRELRIVREDDRLYCQHRHPATTDSERSVGVP
ncbi:HAD family phosphatase, partial [Pseudomonas aeruginosa]|nr:HAD family phosphatase [Pseudomonas aeruginosa]